VQYDIQMVPGIRPRCSAARDSFRDPHGSWEGDAADEPFSRLADRIIAASPRAGGRQMQEAACWAARCWGACGRGAGNDE